MTDGQRLHQRACTLLNIDSEKVRLVGPAEFRQLEGYGVSRNYGISGLTHPVVYVRRGQKLDTHVHEILHLLFRSRPHWWIFEAAWKIAGTPPNQRGWAYGYGKSLWAGGHKVEARGHLLQLAQAAAKRHGYT